MELDHKISTLTPVLTVDPIEDAVEFYKELGFSEVFSIPDANGRVVPLQLEHPALSSETGSTFTQTDSGGYPFFLVTDC